MLEFIPHLDTKWALHPGFLRYPEVQNGIIWIPEILQDLNRNLELQDIFSESLI